MCTQNTRDRPHHFSRQPAYSSIRDRSRFRSVLLKLEPANRLLFCPARGASSVHGTRCCHVSMDCQSITNRQDQARQHFVHPSVMRVMIAPDAAEPQIQAAFARVITHGQVDCAPS